MIKLCNDEKQIKNIVEYIGDHYKHTPYMYANIVKYGIGNQNIKGWVDYSKNNKILGIYLLYYDCLHFFTNEVDTYPIETIIKVLDDVEHKVFMTTSDIGKRIENRIIATYKIEQNYIMDMDNVGIEEKEYRSQLADRDDLEDIADLLLMSDEYTNVYSKEILLKQMMERYDNNYSRFFIIKQDGIVVAACSTYGEVQEFAIVGGVIVHPNYKKRGLAFEVDNYACHILQKENFSRISFVNVNNVASLALHEKLGAKPISILYKFVKNK